MNKNSKSYKKASELDKKGLCSHLQREFEISTVESGEAEQSMGNLMKVARSGYTAGLAWLTEPNKDDSGEYEVEELMDQSLEESEVVEIAEDEESGVEDRAIKKTTSVVKASCEALKALMNPSRWPQHTFKVSEQDVSTINA